MMDNTKLERLLSSAFHGGELTRRELRLPDEEAKALAEQYPAEVTSLGEQWYLIDFGAKMQMSLTGGQPN